MLAGLAGTSKQKAPYAKFDLAASPAPALVAIVRAAAPFLSGRLLSMDFLFRLVAVLLLLFSGCIRAKLYCTEKQQTMKQLCPHSRNPGLSYLSLWFCAGLR